MTVEPISPPPSLRETAEGVAVRGAVLLAGGLLVSGWLTALFFKVASKAVHLLLVVGLGLITFGLAAYGVKKVEEKFEGE